MTSPDVGRLRLGEINYLMTVVLLTIVLMGAIGWWAMKVGALEERAKQRAVVDSLLVVELLEHTDSIVTAVAMMQVYRLLRENDSIIRARRQECGPLLVGC